MDNHANIVDHTLLAPDATKLEIKALCTEATTHGFFSVCVSPTYVATAAKNLSGSEVKVCTVVGFPSGAHTAHMKAAETAEAVAAGADEIDMVINRGLVKAGEWDALESEIRAVVEAADGRLVKVILETTALTDDEVVAACERAKKAGAHFVKTSTGFGGGGATVHHVALMRRTVGPDMGVKASGGVRTKEDLLAMVDAGASRIGASAGAKLL